MEENKFDREFIDLEKERIRILFEKNKYNYEDKLNFLKEKIINSEDYKCKSGYSELIEEINKH